MDYDHLTKMRNIVKEKGLTMQDLGFIFKKSASTINNYLAGKTDLPISFFIDFCNYFNVPYLHILSSSAEHQRLTISLNKSALEVKYLKEISELKDIIMELQNEVLELSSQKKKISC